MITTKDSGRTKSGRGFARRVLCAGPPAAQPPGEQHPLLASLGRLLRLPRLLRLLRMLRVLWLLRVLRLRVLTAPRGSRQLVRPTLRHRRQLCKETVILRFQRQNPRIRHPKPYKLQTLESELLVHKRSDEACS